jgi:hypothetical protein
LRLFLDSRRSRSVAVISAICCSRGSSTARCVWCQPTSCPFCVVASGGGCRCNSLLGLTCPAVTDFTLSTEIVRDGRVCCEQSAVCASFHLHDPTLPCCMCSHTRCAAADLTLSSSCSISLFLRAPLLQLHLNEQVRYPRKFSPDLRSLLGGLLSKDTSVRKQCATSMATHPWFARTDWAAVAAKQLIPPTIPRGPFRHQGKR